MAGWRKWAAAAVAAAAVCASAYFWWWKPFVLASLRFAIETALSSAEPAIRFRSLDLRGLSTIVLRDVAVGSLDDPNSLAAREARLTFDLRALVRGRLDVAAALRRAELVRPQVILAWPDAIAPRKDASAPALPLPPHASFAISDGWLLLRTRAQKPVVFTVHGIDASLARDDAAGWAFSVSLDPPGSPRGGFSVSGTFAPGTVRASVRASRVRPAPLLPWIAPLNPPLRIEDGSLSASLDLVLSSTRTGSAWRLVQADGRLDADGATVRVPGFPMPITGVSGRARASGTTVSLEKVMFTTSRTAWIAGGTVEDFASPRVHLELGAPAFELSLLDPGAAGAGPVRLRAEGPAASPVVTAIFDLAGAEAGGVSATRMTGTLTIEGFGRQIQLEGGRAVMAAGVLACSGAGSPASGSADANFSFVPADRLLPQVSGSLVLRRGDLRWEAKTGDGAWTFRGRGRRRGGSYEVSAAGNATGGARCSLSGTAGVRAPGRLNIDAEIAKADFAVLYLEKRHEIFSRLPVTLNAAITLRGDAGAPALTANLAGSRLAVGRTNLPVTGTLRISPGKLELVSVKAGTAATVALVLPLRPGAPSGSARITGEGFPLDLVRALVPAGEWTRNVDGAFHGTVEILDLSGRPSVAGAGEIRGFEWKDLKLGTLGFRVEESDRAPAAGGRAMRFTMVSIKGPQCAAEGEGSLALTDGGWSGAARLNVSYLKAGTTDIDAHADIRGASGPGGGISASARVTNLRMNAAPYTDIEGELAIPRPGELEVKVSWEDVLSAVWESRAGKSVSLSASCTDLAPGPLLGILRIPSPAESLTGTVSLRGSPDRASLKADLRWARGEISARGRVSAPSPSAGSLTLTASDRSVVSWIPFLREAAGLKNLPDVDGSVSTRGFAVEWSPEVVDFNGWITVRDATVRGRAVGSGSVRLERAGGETEIEGSVKGDAGEFRLYPTKVSVSGGERTISGSFSWGGVQAGKAVCSLSRGTIQVRRRGGTSSGTLVLTGLALDDLSAPDMAFRFEGTPDSWRLSSPPASAWQSIGTVATPGGRISVLPDDRTGGRWVVIRGPDGAQVKLTGTWPLPNAPEKLGFEGHLLRAAPILVAIGAPVQEGMAEADLTYAAAADPPLSGRISLSDGRWGGFAYDLFELRGTGEPGRAFTFTAIRIERAGELRARGTGSITLVPERSISLDLSVEKLALRYLSPFGFVEGGDAGGLGRLVVSGNLDDPDVRGSLVCTPGTYTPPTGFAELRLAEGRLDLKGRSALMTATLNDATGAAVLVAGEASYAKLMPTSYTVSMTAPTWILVDGLPRLYKGLAKGRIRLEGTPAEPRLRGEVTLRQGRMQSPPKAKNPDPESFPERVDWDLRVSVGDGVSYAVEPVAGAALDVAQLNPKSYLHVKGRGAGFEVFGEVVADSGPVTLIMGKQLFRKEAP